MADLNSGREPIKHESANLALKSRDEVDKIVKVFRGAMNCRGEVSFERTGNLKDLIPLRMTYQECGWTKDLPIKIRAEKGICIRFKKCGPHLKSGAPGVSRSFGNNPHSSVALPPGQG